MSELGERVRDFRDFYGLTQAELARRIGVSQPFLSQVERGQVAAENAVEGIISEFNVGFAFFNRGRPSLRNEHTGSMRYRRRSRTKASATRRATALFAELYDSVNVLAPHVGLTSVRFNQIQGSVDDIEAAATAARAAMDLDEFQPVPNVIRRCENLGIVIVRLEFGDESIDEGMVGHDGVSAWETPLDVPVIGYFPSASGDRQRHTIAHELGHLILHRDLVGAVSAGKARQVEVEASRFASALLVPAPPLRAALAHEHVTLGTLLSLKGGWGVSIASLIMRAADLGLIDDHKKASLWKQMSVRGWRKREPGKVGVEEPKLCTEIIRRFESDVAGVTGLPSETLRLAMS